MVWVTPAPRPHPSSARIPFFSLPASGMADPIDLQAKIDVVDAKIERLENKEERLESSSSDGGNTNASRRPRSSCRERRWRGAQQDEGKERPTGTSSRSTRSARTGLKLSSRTREVPLPSRSAEVVLQALVLRVLEVWNMCPRTQGVVGTTLEGGCRNVGANRRC